MAWKFCWVHSLISFNSYWSYLKLHIHKQKYIVYNMVDTFFKDTNCNPMLCTEIVGWVSYAPQINYQQWTIQMYSEMLIVDSLPPRSTKDLGWTRGRLLIQGRLTLIPFPPPHPPKCRSGVDWQNCVDCWSEVDWHGLPSTPPDIWIWGGLTKLLIAILGWIDVKMQILGWLDKIVLIVDIDDPPHNQHKSGSHKMIMLPGTMPNLIFFNIFIFNRFITNMSWLFILHHHFEKSVANLTHVFSKPCFLAPCPTLYS